MTTLEELADAYCGALRVHRLLAAVRAYALGRLERARRREWFED